jgi:hypothetical protein
VVYGVYRSTTEAVMNNITTMREATSASCIAPRRISGENKLKTAPADCRLASSTFDVLE